MVKRVVFVVGMHRSGTSLLAKAVQVMGADLGTDLMGASQFNAKGYWEDNEVYRLNEWALEALDLTWDTPSLLPLELADADRLAAIRREIGRVLERKAAVSDLIGIKDPRFAILLPLWLEEAAELGLKTLLAAIVRNPLDVAASLTRRDQFDRRKGLLLWRSYNILVLGHLSRQDGRCIYFDYQALLKEPRSEMHRLGRFLSGAPPAGELVAPVEEFIGTFLDPGLCHSESTLDALEGADREVPGVLDLYRRLKVFTRAGWSRPDADDLLARLDIATLEAQNYRWQRFYAKEALQRALEHQRTELGRRHEDGLARATQEAAEVRVSQSTLTDLQTRIDALVELLRTKETSKVEAIRAEQGEIFRAILADKDRTIRQLRTEQSDMARRVTELETERDEKEAVRLKREQEIRDLRASVSWKLTAPLRWLVELGARRWDRLSSLRGRQIVPLRGMVSLGSDRWRSVDEDPQVGVQICKAGLAPGWYRMRLWSEGLLDAEVYLDYGDGFSPQHCVYMAPKGSYLQAEFRIPRAVFRLRLDPRPSAGECSLDRVTLRRRFWLRVLIDKGIYIYQRDRRLGRSPVRILGEKIRIVRRIGLWESLVNFDRYVDEVDPSSQPVAELEYSEWIEHVERKHFSSLDAAQTARPYREHRFLIFDTGDAQHPLDPLLKSLQDQRYRHWKAVVLCSDHAAPARGAPWQNDERMVFIPFGPSQVKDLLADIEQAVVTLVSPAVTLSPYYLVALDAHLDEVESKEFIVYADSDRIAESGERTAPKFKPEWSPEYFLEHDYIGDTIALAPVLLRRFAPEIWLRPPSPAWWILLQHAVGQGSADILHLPFVLFHERHAPITDPRAQERLEQLNGALARIGARAITTATGAFKVDYAVPANKPSVTILIPTRDRVDLLQRCVSTVLMKTEYANYDVIIIDNQSRERATRKYLQTIADRDRIQVLHYDRPFNFSAINNFAASKTRSDFLCFLNNDIEIIDGNWLGEMVALAMRRDVGAVGAKLLYPNGSVQHGGVLLGKGGVAGHVFTGRRADDPGYEQRLVTVQNYSAVTGACLLTPRSLFEQLEGFNVRYLPVAFNDVDYCLRLRERGLKILWTPHVRLLHHESASRGEETLRMEAFSEEIRFMQARWGDWLHADPAYNPHLSLDGEFRPSSRWLHEHQGLPSQEKVDAGRRPYAFETNMGRVKALLEEGRRFSTPPRYASGLSVVILTLEKPELIGPLLDALIAAKEELARGHGIEMEIIVGDTGSKRSDVRAIYEGRLGQFRLEDGMRYHFSRCNNDLFDRHVRFDKVLFLNNDIVFSDAPRQLAGMSEVLLQEPGTGIVGTTLIYPDGRLQHNGVDVFREGELKGLCYHPGHGQPVRDQPPPGHRTSPPATTGACLMIRSELFRSCGGFDERYGAEAQDVDLCFKAKRLGAATRLVYVGPIVHLENATRSRGEANARDRARFIRKWAGFHETIFSCASCS